MRCPTIFLGNMFYFYVIQNADNIAIQDSNVAYLLTQFDKANKWDLRRTYCDDVPNQRCLLMLKLIISLWFINPFGIN